MMTDNTANANTNYTTINHVARKQLGLTWVEYGLADLIYNLANRPGSYFPGWCDTPKSDLANMLDITERGLFKVITRLLDKDLIEKHPITKHLRITLDWYSNVITPNHEQSSYTMNKVHEQSSVSEREEENKKDNKENKEKESNKEKETKEKTKKTKEEESVHTSNFGIYKKFSSLEDITQVEMEQIAGKYQVPASFVASKLDDLINWHEKSPRKNHYANYYRGLMDWVKKDAIKLIERSKGDPTKRPIDASKL